MLKYIKLNNFVSHYDTKIEFSEGVNVFVGQNGAGKSSVIDAITYALYGKHGRGNNANIVRKNSQYGSVELEFLNRGNVYNVYRRFDETGSLFTAILTMNKKQLVGGGKARKGVKEEGVTKQIESILDLNYEDISIATIIRQGELDDIIELKPREVKELINRLVGVDKLDKAYQQFRDVLDDFKTKLRGEIGYDVADLERIERELKINEQKKHDTTTMLKSINELLEKKDIEKKSLEEKLKELQLLQGKYYEYLARKEELYNYLGRKRDEYMERYNKLGEIIKEGYRYLDVIKDKSVEERYSELLEQEKRMIRLEDLKKIKSREEDERRRIEKEIANIKKDIDRCKAVEPINIEYSIRDKINLVREKIADINETLGKMTEKLQNYETIQSKGVCPVCDSVISNADLSSKINEIIERQRMLQNQRQELENEEENLEDLSEKKKRYDEAQIELNKLLKRNDELQDRLEDINKKIKEIEDELSTYVIISDKKSIENEMQELKRKIKELHKAEEWLSIHKISNMDDINKLEKERDDLLDTCSLLNNIKSLEINKLAIDDYSKELINKIGIVEIDAMKYNISEHETLSSKLNKIDKERDELISKKGMMNNIIDETTKKIDELNKAKEMIEHSLKYINFYEKIREDVYHKRLPAELREWAFEELSNKTSEYLNIFNIGISHIKLKEENNDVNINCYGSSDFDIRSMSGGEKVAIALALRFAIASLRGKGNTDFIILDEPTMHLDQQKKKALVKLILKLGGSASLLRQIIMITHDDEIIDDAEIDNIIKFEKKGGISHVIIEK